MIYMPFNMATIFPFNPDIHISTNILGTIRLGSRNSIVLAARASRQQTRVWNLSGEKHLG